MIELEKDKIIFTNEYNPECSEYVRKEVPHLWPYLEDKVMLDEDFTLEDLFNHIERDKEAFEIIFHSSLGHFPIQAYLDEIKKEGQAEDNEIDYLEVQRFGERWDYGDIELHIDFHGIGIKDDIGYAVEFTPLNQLKHLQLHLNEEFEISEIVIPSWPKLKFYRLLKRLGLEFKKCNPYTHVYTSGKVCFSVYELISTVLSEVSFCGMPSERDEKWRGITELFDEFEHPERYDGKNHE